MGVGVGVGGLNLRPGKLSGRRTLGKTKDLVEG